MTKYFGYNELPITSDNSREEICAKYADRIWRMTDTKDITTTLLILCEVMYSRGGRDRDKMYQKVNDE